MPITYIFLFPNVSPFQEKLFGLHQCFNQTNFVYFVQILQILGNISKQAPQTLLNLILTKKLLEFGKPRCCCCCFSYCCCCCRGKSLYDVIYFIQGWEMRYVVCLLKYKLSNSKESIYKRKKKFKKKKHTGNHSTTTLMLIMKTLSSCKKRDWYI